MNARLGIIRQPIRTLRISGLAFRRRAVASDHGAEDEEDGDKMEKSETLRVGDEDQDEV